MRFIETLTQHGVEGLLKEYGLIIAAVGGGFAYVCFRALEGRISTTTFAAFLLVVIVAAAVTVAVLTKG
jgi:hypothetical protein